MNSSGDKVVEYTYGPFGEMLSVTGSSSTTYGQINPFRYRSYYYDSETGLYYLNSRYYDPEVGRFISADGQISGVGGDILGYNMFAYCMNNPVNMSDSTGNWPKWLSGVLDVVSGTLQMVAGATIGAAAGWTGVGAVAAAALVVNGAATVTQGVGQIVNVVTNTNIMREDNIVRSGVQSVGRAVGGDTGATIAGGVYDVAILTAGVYGAKIGSAGNSPMNTSGGGRTPNTTNTKITYPGNDPTKCNVPGYEWRGSGPPASGKGNFVNMKTGSWLHPDLNHGPPIGPHWDYGVRGNNQTFRIFPDGSIVPK